MKISSILGLVIQEIIQFSLSLSCVDSSSCQVLLSLCTECKANKVIQKVTLKINNFFKKKKAGPIAANLFIIMHTKRT